MAKLKPHPLADLLPAMTDSEYTELRESIRANGLREPITLHPDGRILDGRSRNRVCDELGIPVRTKPFKGRDSDALAYVLDLNVVRRHLDESQRAMIAADLETLKHGGARRVLQDANLHLDRAAAAKLLNVSPRTVADAKAVRDSAIPAIIAAVRQGHMPVSQAVLVARLPPPRQRQVADRMHSVTSLKALVLAATRGERVDTIERAAQHVPLSTLGRTFPVIYADPPWHFPWSAGGDQKAAKMHYPTMPTADICALPVADIAAHDSVLFMWAVPALFPDALEVVMAWGFTFKTFAVWLKPNTACGHWFRGKHEPLIVATRGNMPPPPEGLHGSIFEGDAFDAERISGVRHSGKPDFVRDWIASAYPNAGKIELFARTAAPGWQAWGNQAPDLAAD